MTQVIGIDVGGTKIAAGVVDLDSGKVLDLVREPTHPKRGGQAVLDRCGRLAAGLGPSPLPVGVGLCELIDLTGRIRSGVTIDWRGLDVAGAFPGSVTLESDVRAAAHAEARFGAGRGLDNFLYLGVGTGIGHSLVLNGRPYPGAHGFAMMVGAPPIEQTASGAALSAAAAADTRAMLDDPTHQSLVDAASRALGQALADLIHALDPGTVVIGGGLGLNAAYRTRITDATRAHLVTEPDAQPPILPATLGETSGVVGAALAAAEHG